MHLAIATLGMGRPVTCFPYQGKFEGQFEHLRLPLEGLIPIAELSRSPEEIAARLAARIEASDAEAAHIQAQLPRIRELALKNFEGL